MKRKPKWIPIIFFNVLILTELSVEIKSTEEPTEPPLVKYGHFCLQPPDLKISGKPQIGPVPFALEIFSVGTENQKTLQLVLRPKDNLIYHYMVMQAIDEEGVPAGQFHHFYCATAKTQSTYRPSGINRVMNCSDVQKHEENLPIKIFENTLVYTSYRPEEGRLQDVIVFWSWQEQFRKLQSKKLQLRYAAVQKGSGEAEDTYWIMLSPIIKTKESISTDPFETGSAERNEINCSTNNITDPANTNFQLADDNSEIAVNPNSLKEVASNTTILATATADKGTSELPNNLQETRSTISANNDPRNEIPSTDKKGREAFPSSRRKSSLADNSTNANGFLSVSEDSSEPPESSQPGSSSQLPDSAQPGSSSQPPEPESSQPGSSSQSPDSTPPGSSSQSPDYLIAEHNHPTARTQSESTTLPYEDYFPTPKQRDGPASEKEMYYNCLKGKGCLEDVPGCTEAQRCHTFATYSPNHDSTRDYFRFELMATLSKGFGYVALGLSEDTKMGDDSVIECSVNSKGRAGIFMSWNSGYQNYRLNEVSCADTADATLTGCNVTFVNGKILCNFYWRNLFNVGGQIFNMLKTPYYIHRVTGHNILDFKTVPRRRRSKRDLNQQGDYDGDGDMDADNSSISVESLIGYHEMTYTTERKRLLLNVDAMDYEYEDTRFIKLHGAFMILAWIFLIPNAVFFARYFKESYRNVRIFQLEIWKVVHIGLNSLAGIFILLGMIMIWVYNGQIKRKAGYYPPGYTHMVGGYVTVALLPMQVLIGVLHLRLSISSNNLYKKLTSSAHFLVGTLSYILALFLIARAYVMITSFLDCYDVLLIISWVIWSALCHVVISVHLFIQDGDLRLNTWRAFLPIPFVVLTSKKVKGEFFRVNVFAFHASGAGIVSVLIIVPYLYSRTGCFCDDQVCS